MRSSVIASVCPGVPHRYCSNHFLRDLAKLVLGLDSHAKVQMRGKIRGLRGIEREVLKGAAAQANQCNDRKRSVMVAASVPNRSDVVLDYCAAVRGIINDSQGGPLRPPGLRMSEELDQLRRSLQRGLLMKGARGSVAGTISGLHRQGTDPGGGDAETSGRVCLRHDS